MVELGEPEQGQFKLLQGASIDIKSPPCSSLHLSWAQLLQVFPQEQPMDVPGPQD